MKNLTTAVLLLVCYLAFSLISYAQDVDDYGNDEASAKIITLTTTTDEQIFNGVLENKDDVDVFALDYKERGTYELSITIDSAQESYSIEFSHGAWTDILTGSDPAYSAQIEMGALTTVYIFISDFDSSPDAQRNYSISVGPYQQPTNLAKICEPCEQDSDCNSGNCADVLNSDIYRCIPSNVIVYSCDIGEDSGGGGCYIETLSLKK